MILGVHVEFCVMLAANRAAALAGAPVEYVLAPPSASEIVTSGVSVNSAASDGIVVLSSSSDNWVAIGPNPDASKSPRIALTAGPRQKFSVNKGDRVAVASQG